MKLTAVIYLVGMVLGAGQAQRYDERQQEIKPVPRQQVQESRTISAQRAVASSQENETKKIDITDNILRHGMNKPIDLADYFNAASGRRSNTTGPFFTLLRTVFIPDVSHTKDGKKLTFTVNNARIKAFFEENERIQRDLFNDLDPHDKKIMENVKARIIQSLQNDADFKKRLYLRLIRRLSVPRVSKDTISQSALDRTFINAYDNKKMLDQAIGKLF